MRCVRGDSGRASELSAGKLRGPNRKCLPLFGGGTPTTAAATATTTSHLSQLWQSLGVVHEECVQRDAVGKNDVPDVVAPDREVVHGNRRLSLHCELDVLHVGVHGDINT